MKNTYWRFISIFFVSFGSVTSCEDTESGESEVASPFSGVESNKVLVARFREWMRPARSSKGLWKCGGVVLVDSSATWGNMVAVSLLKNCDRKVISASL